MLKTILMLLDFIAQSIGYLTVFVVLLWLAVKLFG